MVMTRPRKKEINLSKDSILSLLQEIYNEPVLEKQQKVINDVVEKKLTLAKLQSTIWEKSSNKEDDNMSLSDIDDDMLQSLIAKDTEQIQSDKPYRLK
jgi:hypothetical protein